MESFADQWKVLVYDDDGRDIISPLLNVQSLRSKGVTLHLLLFSEREQISDAPSVYFIKPTEQNIKRVLDDCSKRLYRSFYIHFITKIDRPLLEMFAKQLVLSNSVSLISKVYDQYLDLICLENNLFTLNIKNSFVSYNQSSLSESDIKLYMNRISYGLLSMIRLVGALPIIRAPPGGPAEMLANELNALIKEQISIKNSTTSSIFSECLSAANSNTNRPLLIIYDRTCDMTPPLLHTSTYQALIDDLLEHKLNRVTVDPSGKSSVASATTPGGPKQKKVYYDMNSNIDNFYALYGGAPIPEAVEANVKDLEEVTKVEAELRSKPGVIGAGHQSAGEGGKALSDVIENLPEILARKKSVETHTNILGALMGQIKKREVPAYFEIEQNIFSTSRISSADKVAILQLLKDNTKGTIMDKARLMAIVSIVMYTNSDSVSGPPASGAGASSALKAACEEYDQAFSQGCVQMTTMTPPPTEVDVTKVLTTIAYLRKLLLLSNSSYMTRSGGGSGGSGLTSFLAVQMKDHLKLVMDKATSFFAKFVAMYITKVVDNLIEQRNCVEDDSFIFVDPKLAVSNTNVRNINMMEYKLNVKYNGDVMVFAIGGGCYSEYNNLQELIKQKNITAASGGVVSSSTSLRSITYGCTEMISGDSFFRQLEALSST